jgi:DNA-directed RNA polymerase I subunit RPA1
LQLLDAGLLDEALRLVTIAPRTSQQREDDEEEHEAVPTETAAEFIARIDAYVQHCLKRASNGGQTSKDAYKDGLVYQERKSTLHEFNKKAWNKCAHCMA